MDVELKPSAPQFRFQCAYINEDETVSFSFRCTHPITHFLVTIVIINHTLTSCSPDGQRRSAAAAVACPRRRRRASPWPAGPAMCWRAASARSAAIGEPCWGRGSMRREARMAASAEDECRACGSQMRIVHYTTDRLSDSGTGGGEGSDLYRPMVRSTAF